MGKKIKNPAVTKVPTGQCAVLYVEMAGLVSYPFYYDDLRGCKCPDLYIKVGGTDAPCDVCCSLPGIKPASLLQHTPRNQLIKAGRKKLAPVRMALQV
jgi:hypothetical protein